MSKLDTSDFKIIVVNYNQEKEIRSFLSGLLNYVENEKVILVDDGSTDNSLEEVQDLRIATIEHSFNKGVGAAIRSGILKAKEDKSRGVIIMSSNGKMLSSELPLFLNEIQKGAEYVTGSRYLNGVTSPGISKFRKWSIPIFSLFYSVLLGKYFSDITCGYRAYRTDFLYENDIDIEQDWLDTYEMEYYIHYYAVKKKLNIKEIPVTIRYDHLEKGRESKIRPIVDWWKMIRPVLYLKLGIKK